MVMEKPKITEVNTSALVVSDLNDVLDETNMITNKFMTMPVVGTNTQGTRISNVFGKARTITIQGRHYGDGYIQGSIKANIKKFIEEVESWINSTDPAEILKIQQRRKYHSIFGISYLVFCNSFTYRWRDTTPVHIEYSMELIEGGNLTTDVISDLFG